HKILLLRAISRKLPCGLLVGFALGLLAGVVTLFPLMLLLAVREMDGTVIELALLRFALEAALSGGIGAGVTVGLPYGIVFGLARGIMHWAVQPAPTSFSTPTLLWRSDKTLTLMRALLFGLATGLPSWIIF